MSTNAAQQRRPDGSHAMGALEIEVEPTRSSDARLAQYSKAREPVTSMVTNARPSALEAQRGQGDVHPKRVPAAGPRIGEIYRDRSNRSLIVLTIIEHDALVEYADGTLMRIDSDTWSVLKPRPHRF